MATNASGTRPSGSSPGRVTSSRRLWRSTRLRQVAQATRGSAVTGVRWLTRQEAAVLVAMLIILLALFGFVRIAEELGEGKLANFDEWLLRLLRVPGHPHVPVGPSWLMEAAHDITALGGRTMLLAVTLFAIGYLPSSESMVRCGW